MAMKKEYLSVDGEIFGEVTGGVVNFYDRDALGSVVAIEDGAGNTVSTIEYKPFGDVRTYTGENPLSSPRRFLWCGSWGYRFNERYAQYTSHYVRARHYSSLQGMWSTVDPLYPRERAYGYVENRVTVGIDPSGKWCYGVTLNKGLFENKPNSFKNSTSKGLAELSSDSNFEAYLSCISDDCRPGFKTNLLNDNMEEQLREWSTHSGKGCDYDFIVERDTGGVWSLCKGGTCSWTDIRARPPIIKVCRSAYEENKCGDLKCVLAHELIHALGHTHSDTQVDRGKHLAPYECIKLLSGCENFSAIHAKSGAASNRNGVKFK